MHWQQPLITQGYGTMQSGPSMPFSTHAGPTSTYPMGHWQQNQNQNQQIQVPQGLGYNSPFRIGTGPTYPMGQQHRQIQVPQGLGYNAPFRVGTGPTISAEDDDDVDTVSLGSED